MPKARDLTGERHGSLVVQGLAYKTHHKFWQCLCDCGNSVVVAGPHLTSGHTQSCGCRPRPKNNTVYEICGTGLCITKGGYFWFSLEDMDFVLSHGWAQRNTTYPNATINKQRVFFHRAVVSAPVDMQVDHINRDIHDCRRENLRVCTFLQNMRNQPAKGWCWSKKAKKFQAAIRHEGRYVWLGYFNTEAEAAAAYAVARDKLRGEFACKYPVDYVYFPM